LPLAAPRVLDIDLTTSAAGVTRFTSRP
jgi:hypothetical protein